MAKIYISSTKVDLDEERELLRDKLFGDGHQPMHSYGRSLDPVVELCLQDVRECDIYVLLLGRRYGYRPPLDNPRQLSITHLEFLEAVEQCKPLIVLEQGRPPMELSDADQGRDDDDRDRKAFWREVDAKATRVPWKDNADLLELLRRNITEAERRLLARESAGAPGLMPGIGLPHARLLSDAMLLVHLADPVDDPLAARLVAALGQRAVGWPLRTWRWNVEDGIDWRALDQELVTCRAAGVLLTSSASRYGPQAAALRRVVDFTRRQCGFVAGFVIGDEAAAMPWLASLGLDQRHRLDDWAAGSSGALTPDLAQAVRDIRLRHRDIEDPKLVGLQCVVVAMTRCEAEQLRDDPRIRASLNDEQERFLAEALAHLRSAGVDWVARYGERREDWQPFGPRDELPFPALAVLREVVDDINTQEVAPRRDQEALKGHRIRLRPYAFDPIVDEDARVLKLMPQVMARRVLVLVDELSLCHPKVRAAAADTLADPLLSVATVAPFDPPAQPVEAVLRGNSVLQLGNLKTRFLQAMDPTCELNLASSARLMRWLRLSIPETLTGQAGNALADRRSSFQREVGSGR